jgi:hypothetical protein
MRPAPGSFGLFHWFAVITLASVAFAAIGAVRQRRSALWAHVHAQAMLGSYYGLIGGLINELFARIVPLRTLAMQMSPHAPNISRTALVGMVQTGAMLLWLALALAFFLQVARIRRRADPGAFTIGHPLRYSGGVFSSCLGIAGIIGAFTGTLGWSFMVGMSVGIVLASRAAQLVRPVWGTPSERQRNIRRFALGVLFAAFMVLGSTGFFQRVPPALSQEVTILIVGVYFLILRGSHGPMMLQLGLSILAWLALAHAAHLPVQLLAIGDGLIKLGFGFAMAEPLRFRIQSEASLARTSDGVAPASRRLASVTA